MFRRTACPLVASLLLVSFASPTCLKAEDGAADYLHRLEKSGDYLSLSHSLWGSFQNTWVKFTVLSPAESGTAYFQASRKYPLHYDFATVHIPAFKGLAPQAYLPKVLLSQDRRAFVGTLFHFARTPAVKDEQALGRGDWGIQIIATDGLSLADIKAVMERVTAEAPFLPPERIYLIPTPEQTAEFSARKGEFAANGIAIRSYEELDPIKSDECYSPGWAVGRLVQARADELESSFVEGKVTERDIVIVDKVLAEMPPVAGLVSETVSVPSGHTALLFRQASKPFLHLKEPKELAQLKALVGRTVALDVRADKAAGCRYGVATQEQGVTRGLAEFFQERRRARVSRQPSKDAATTTIAPVGGFRRTDAKTYGAKAANYSEMHRILKGTLISKGVGVPFHYFERFLDEEWEGKTHRRFIQERLSAHGEPYDLARLAADLAAIRDRLQKAPLPESIARPLKTAIASHFGGDKQMLFLRSSTNAEDGDEFNGAGLYESKSGCLADDALPAGAGSSSCDPDSKKARPFGAALKKVWASLYSLNAFVNWSRFGIEWRHVSMAVLVNPFHSPLLANGVSVAAGSDPLDIEFDSQVGNEEVTNPSPSLRPERATGYCRRIAGAGPFECLLYYEQNSGLLPPGQRVLSEREYSRLAAAIAAVAKAYRAHTRLPLDFEWLKLKDGSLALAQVRPLPDSMAHSSMRGVPPFIWGAKQMELRSCSTFERLDANRQLRSKFRLTADWDARFFGEGLLNEDFIRNIRIEWGPDADERVEFANLSAIGGLTRRYEKGVQGEGRLRLSFKLPSGRGVQIDERRRTGVRPGGLAAEPLQFPVSAVGRGLEVGPEHYDVTLEQSARPPVYYGGGDAGDDGTDDRLQLCSHEASRIPLGFVESRSRFEGKRLSLGIRYRAQDINRAGADIRTTFPQLEEVSVSGLLDKPFTLKSYWAMSYGSLHHNVGQEIILDPQRDDALAPAVKAALLERRIRYIVMHLLEGEYDPKAGGDVRKWAVLAVDEDFKGTEVDRVTPDYFPNGGRRYEARP